MSPDPSIMELVLSELKQIRESLHELRLEINDKLGVHTTELAKLTQWRELHETAFREQSGLIQGNQALISEIRGGLRAIRWIGALVGAAFAALEAWLHRG